ncbi:DUF2141 domain-containing protein [Azospirillum picis]|uniref:Uncharacterized protein (DUF2141 family) n=1 Tax=Azospirillum picis TaxID=488438 RepID=A0ABU0MN69_9PROT|nr:DUF2141 domain-containing protein [Azospirillum picis]MBP2301136.1 uncharacterized protein (DUF2141 family) [Azospirillum picis]MDQ0534902.1 uncharacterized protein (DUF2141 family) [Azospirillum picis]
MTASRRLTMFLALAGGLLPFCGLGPSVTASAQPAVASGADAGPVLTGEAAPCGDSPTQVRLHVEATNVRNDHGMITITVYGDNPAEFLAPGKKLARLRTPAHAGATAACLGVPARRSYAIALYHDENNDRDFNRNLLGFPVEGYGISNDAPAIAGIPSYESARFTATEGDNRLSIRLRY